MFSKDLGDGYKETVKIDSTPGGLQHSRPDLMLQDRRLPGRLFSSRRSLLAGGSTAERVVSVAARTDVDRKSPHQSAISGEQATQEALMDLASFLPSLPFPIGIGNTDRYVLDIPER